MYTDKHKKKRKNKSKNRNRSKKQMSGKSWKISVEGFAQKLTSELLKKNKYETDSRRREKLLIMIITRGRRKKQKSRTETMNASID